MDDWPSPAARATAHPLPPRAMLRLCGKCFKIVYTEMIVRLKVHSIYKDRLFVTQIKEAAACISIKVLKNGMYFF